MDTRQGLALMEQTRTIAIVRGIEHKHIVSVAEALLAGGISIMEVTLNTPGALAMIYDLQEKMGDRMFIGAGTVLNMEDAHKAIEAGASFFVTPNVDEEVIRYAAAREIPSYPGAMTPTEVVRAWNAGATAVKVFPTSSLGAGYIKELQGPLSHIPMLAVGGVHEDNLIEFMKAGCHGFGIGSVLFNRQEIERGNYEATTHTASRITTRIQEYLKSNQV
jgi:2-dehydro-3-deoxyphosphogluconate aldolase / (4S)-4-hydroxy-2-oxoglutarate aldolase